MSSECRANKQRPIKLAIVISDLSRAGAERQVIEIANGLDKERFEVHICSLSAHVPLAATLIERESRLHIFPRKHRFDTSVVFKIARLVKLLEIDILHGFLFDAEIATRIAGAIAGTQLVVGSERNSTHNYKKIQYFCYKFTNRLVDICIANSRSGATFNKEHFNLSDHRYRIVYNGVDTGRFRPMSSDSLRVELGIPNNCYVLGIIGTFKKQKNHPYLLHAIRELAEIRSDFRLLIVGGLVVHGDAETESYHRSVMSLIAELKLEDYCVVLGSRDDMELIYNLCDVTVLPSLHEGTPNVALESLACGVPVVATNVSDNADVIPDNKVGFIVPLNDCSKLCDCINLILSDTGLRLKFKAAARKWILSNFSTEQMISNISRVYTEGLTEF